MVEFEDAGGTNLILDSINGTFEDTTFDFTGASSIVVNLGARQRQPDAVLVGRLRRFGHDQWRRGRRHADGQLRQRAGDSHLGATFNGGTQTTTGDLVRVWAAARNGHLHSPQHDQRQRRGRRQQPDNKLHGLGAAGHRGHGHGQRAVSERGHVLGIANGTTFGGGAQPAIVVSGTSGGVGFETVALRNKRNVNIDTTTVAGVPDLVTIKSADNAHGNTNLTITTGAASGDMIDISGGVT